MCKLQLHIDDITGGSPSSWLPWSSVPTTELSAFVPYYSDYSGAVTSSPAMRPEDDITLAFPTMRPEEGLTIASSLRGKI